MPEWRNWQTHWIQNPAGNHVGSSPTLGTKSGFTRTRKKHCYKRVQRNPKRISLKSRFTSAYFFALFSSAQ